MRQDMRQHGVYIYRYTQQPVFNSFSFGMRQHMRRINIHIYIYIQSAGRLLGMKGPVVFIGMKTPAVFIPTQRMKTVRRTTYENKCAC